MFTGLNSSVRVLSKRFFRCFFTVISFGISLQTAGIADDAPVPSSRKLSAAEQQQVATIKPKLVTPLNAKDNPGDRDTWYVVGFMDSAAMEIKSREATMAGMRTCLWTQHTDKQQKIVRDAVVVQGRTAAAIAVMDFLNAPNQATAQLHGPASAREGWIKRQTVNAASGRSWEYRAFDNEGAARRFLEAVRPKK